MGRKTEPHITGDEWASAFARNTQHNYNGDNVILYTESLLAIVARLVGTVNTRWMTTLIAWSLFRQLSVYTDVRLLLATAKANDACFTHVDNVMKLAFAAAYLHFVMPQETVKTATSLAMKIREAFHNALNTSSWVESNVKRVALRKLSNMKFYIGSSGQRLDPAKIDKYYDDVPDVDKNRFFKAYKAALQAAAHQSWKDHTTYIFDETKVNAYYATNLNTMVIPAAVLQHPFFNVGSPPALNYGSIGMTTAHEIMHGYDVDGSEYDADNQVRKWTTPKFLKTYTERVICIRDSHKTVETRRARQADLDAIIDSENLADIVGVAIAHAAFASLPLAERNVTIPGLNLTAEHLFFISHCAKWCESERVIVERYAPGRSRCIVPLMNMAAFSEAFQCAPNTPMNPSKKCSFW
ncbi:endothelin-converting enzyme 1 [Rhipicephalus microplus]|uniref:endothelin-converting enzyme 1 n=1 Tax=Rhipicephalus microplus TaxID=6941 RepID=UPI003F6D9B80